MKRPSSVYLFDLDYFKKINDTFGHDAGDSVLVEIAGRLKSGFGPDYCLVRLGGDEFVIALGADASGSPDVVVDKINGVFDVPYDVQERRMKLSASIGVALQDGDTDIQTLLKQADIALYRAKADGRKTYHVYTASVKYEHAERFIQELDLANAAERGELSLAYQPIYGNVPQRVVAAEVLLRWNREGYGAIAPANFIPVAEETGLIIPIGYWVIREACKCWRDNAKIFGSAFKLSINISSVQLNDPGFVAETLRILESENVSPRSFELEITESMVIHNVQAVRRTLGVLREAGFTIALDDFGTGYSSLNMLKQLPLDKLKIDKSLIEDLNRPLIAAILMMARALSLDVIVEGVEQADQFNALSEMECWGLQGYLIGKPVDAEDLGRFRTSLG